jgi:hypothetical protein
VPGGSSVETLHREEGLSLGGELAQGATAAAACEQSCAHALLGITVLALICAGWLFRFEIALERYPMLLTFRDDLCGRIRIPSNTLRNEPISR